MKKLLLVLSIVATVVACKNKGNTTNTNAAAMPKPASVGGWPRPITLNGVDSTSAVKMIAHFDSCKGFDTKPWRQCVWFNIKTIRQIVKLLENEIKEERKKQGPQTADKRMGITDGIRIYYTTDTTCTLNTAMTGIKLSNSVVLVSTKFGGDKIGPPREPPSKAIHNDYYTHSYDSLFAQLDSIKGTVSHKGFLQGETTYNICLTDCNTPPCAGDDGLHYITKKQAHTMVENFAKTRAIYTTSEWFELELFKAFADSEKLDGLRIYFARRPMESNTRTSEKDAFLLVPTVAKKYLGRPVHEDYFNCEVTKSYFADFKKRTHWTKDKLHPYKGGGQDNGELCPDNCDK